MSRMPGPRRPRARRTPWMVALATLAASALPLVVTATVATAPVSAAPGVAEAKTVIGVRRIGTSVNGRAIRAFHLGDPTAGVTAVVMGSMHGNETAGMAVVDSLRDGGPVHGVDLWLIPTINPDGVARNTRGNARGVDLNRNFPHEWAPLTGSYYSGTKPLSEPESRALRTFLNKVDPDFVVSFHQPLYGVGRSGKGKPLQRRLSAGLDLPIRSFNCTGKCHGSMTSWFNANHKGAAITVEFGSSPSRTYLRGQAARGTLRAVLGSRF